MDFFFSFPKLFVLAICFAEKVPLIYKHEERGTACLGTVIFCYLIDEG